MLEALKSWPKWKRSLEIARAKMESKYGNVANLIAGASVECEVIDEGSSSETVQLFVNNEQWTKWKIETELDNTAKDFVKRAGFSEDFWLFWLGFQGFLIYFEDLGGDNLPIEIF